MKKLFAALVVLVLALGFTIPSLAGPVKPTKQDILVMKHDLLNLWHMGIGNAEEMDRDHALFSSLRFILRGELGDSVEYRADYPDRFTNLPEKYDLFVSSANAKQVAFRVFNAFLEEELPHGVFLGAEGYYICTSEFNAGTAIAGDSYLPSYCSIEGMMQQADGTLLLSGKVRVFKQNFDTGEEILWASAPFMARFSPEDGGWHLVTFIFTEEAMG
jgi:hypothetical protein